MYYYWYDADASTSNIEHNNITNGNNIHYSSSCNNDDGSLKYSDDNMKINNTKCNNIINTNGGGFYPLHEIHDDGYLVFFV